MSSDLIKKNTGRQPRTVAAADFTFEDIDSTNFIPVFDMPVGAVPLEGYILIEEGFGTSVTVSVGTEQAGTKYASGVDANTAAKTALSGIDGKVVGGKQVGVTFSAVPTAGKGTLVIEYYDKNRADFAQG